MAKEPKTADSGFMTQDKTKVDLIYRQAAIEALEVKYMSFGIFREQRAASQCIDVIKHLPSAQPERKKGRWIYYPEINALSCSECKRYVYHYEPYNYCPNCGAEMEGEDG